MNVIRLKPNWENYLHCIRNQEIELFKNYLKKGHEKILEIGAGDGFQSRLLVHYCSELHCTELNKNRLIQIPNSKIHYKICDAEKIDQYYPTDTFDIVYSSNVFEHLPSPSSALRGIKKVLKENGMLINIMPNPLFDITIIAFHYPNFFLKKLESLINHLFGSRNKNDKKVSMENNLKVQKDFGKVSKLFKLPKPHGIGHSFREEIVHFSKKNWMSLFEQEGFQIVEVIKGPFYSGYGFGLNVAKKILESVGICSEYIYVLKNANMQLK